MKYLHCLVSGLNLPTSSYLEYKKVQTNFSFDCNIDISPPWELYCILFAEKDTKSHIDLNGVGRLIYKI